MSGNERGARADARIGQLLLREGLLTPEALEEALASQVVHGGRLGTNLVELGLLQERELARMLGLQHHVAFASGEMKADPKALALVDPRFCDDKDVLPMRVDATRITVAAINPRDLETLDAIGFKTGKRVIPVVVPEFRMHQLLRRYCAAFRPLRAIDMNVVRPSRTLAAKEEATARAEDLMSEDEFQALYAQAMSGESFRPEDTLDEIEIEEVAPEPAIAPTPAGGTVPSPTFAPSPQPNAARSTEDRVARPIGVATSEPPPEPLSFAEAQKLLQASNDREDIARTVLRFALGKWKRALLLSVQGNLLTGWHGVGLGIRDEVVRRIGVALRQQSTFKLVRDTRSHYVGPMKPDAGTTVFYKLLGGGFPLTAVLMPLLVRGKVVHRLYVDDGPEQLTPPDIGELLILSQNVTRSYETLLERHKGKGASYQRAPT